MAFEFIVEDGTQVLNSNSYISVADASVYLESNIHVAASWQALTTLDQQHLLVWASRHLDQRAVWFGKQTSSFCNPSTHNVISQWSVPTSPSSLPLQSMRWPRVDVRDVDGNLIPSNVIPPALKEATAEMARFLIASDRTLERPQDSLTELKVEGVTLRFRDTTLAIVPAEIAFILRNLGTISNGKTNFSKITRA